jgi:AAA domain
LPKQVDQHIGVLVRPSAGREKPYERTRLGPVIGHVMSVTPASGDFPRSRHDYSGAVAVVFVTGMSGTGKSSALAELARRGYRVVDTDHGGYAEEVPSPDAGGWEQLWREDRIAALLDGHGDGVLFLSGCASNQGKFYPRFDAVVLLSAPEDVILERVAGRESNAFGKSRAERDRILDDLANVEPRLRASATAEIDTRAPLDEVVDMLEGIAASLSRRDTPS